MVPMGIRVPWPARRPWRRNEGDVCRGIVMLHVTFVVDSVTTPSSIDYTLVRGPHRGQTQRGIYELDGEVARYCMAAPGDERPAEFVTRAGDGRTLSVWRKCAG